MNMEYSSIHNAVPYSLPYNFFFFLVMVLIVGAPAEASTPLCLSNQSSALLQFKRSIDLLPDRLSSWKEDTDCCRWEGVTCDSLSGFVTELRIRSALERSSMTLDHSLFRLSHLRVLDLRDNRFSGTIPKRVAELTRLTHLDLSDCSFSGEVPKEISRLTRLVYLDLSWNDDLQLDASILPLGSLSYLDLSGNTLSSPPEFFPNLTSLRVLKLSNCGLASFTSGIFLLPKLEMLDVSNNGKLVASLPSEVIPPSSNIRHLDISGARKLYGDLRVLSNLTELMHLDLRYSAINGSIPPSWALERITVLYLSSNNLSGSIPEGICSSSNLTQLHLSHNSLSGTIPPCLFNLSHLEQIDLRGNLLSSGISSPRFNLPFINSIYLSQNLLTGSIHSSIFNLPTLRYLHLHDNRLTGEIAATIVNLDSLLESRLSNNMLTGSIPSFLFNLSNLNTLDLRDNKFSGSIPSFNQISGITELFLGNNCLSGDVTSIGKPGLGRLDLSSNCFSGAILFPFFNLESLELLDFSNNKALTGLQSSNSSFSYDGTGSLHLLNLSWCAFDGFPRVLGNLQHRNYMAVLDLSDNDMRGNIPSWFWGIFDTVRLDNNEIEGFEAVNRSSIRARDLRVFAAHNNHIAGEIPSFICKNFTQLEVLDMSNNDLAGTIPVLAAWNSWLS